MTTHFAVVPQQAACGSSTATEFTTVPTAVTCLSCKRTIGEVKKPDPFTRTN